MRGEDDTTMIATTIWTFAAIAFSVSYWREELAKFFKA